jgi:hypothetical protein
MTLFRHAAISMACAGAALALAPGAALANTVTKAQCIDANTRAQDLRRDGELSAAREQLRLCTSPVCPGLVRSDCTKRLDELESAQPTILFDVKDGAGHDLTEVTVTMDGHPLADKLDGTALQVDPGEHEFVFRAPGQDPVTDKVLIKESEKARREKVVIGAAPPAAAPPPHTAPPPEASTDSSGTRRLIGLLAGGAGLAGIAVGSVFGLLTSSAIKTQKNDCSSATNCPNYPDAASAHNTWTTDGAVSTAAFIAGGALLVGGAVLFFTARHPAEQAPPATTGLVVVPSVGPGGGGMLLRGEF